MEHIKNKIKSLFTIDIRSLAIFRIGLALVLIIDLIVRLQDLKAHYSDEGVLPRFVMINHVISEWDLSLHFLNGTWQIQLILFILSLIFAFALLIGYKTRLSTIVSWLLLISLHSRNLIILQGGDTVLRMLLFWGMFLPLGACWSLDKKLCRKPIVHTQVVSMATCALLLQIAFIYWFTAILKTDDSWRVTGTATWYALSLEQCTTKFGLCLLQFPDLLKILTFATFYLEAFGPFLAFSPIWTGPLRFITVVMFLFFHLVGINLTMELAHFTYICAVAWLVFIPKWFWDKILTSKPSEISLKPTRYSNILAGFFLSIIFLWNVNTLDFEEGGGPLPQPIAALGSLLRLDQYWNMFTPYPLKSDGWYVIPATLKDGSRVDLFTGGQPITYEKPKLISAMYPNDRWRSFMVTMLFDEQSQMFLHYYSIYLAKQWNKNHSQEKQIKSFDIEFMWKYNNINAPATRATRVILWHYPEEKDQ